MCWDLEHGRVLTEDTRSHSVLSSQSGHLSVRLSGQNVARDSRKFAYGTTGGCKPASWHSFHFEPRKRAQVSALQPRQPSSGQSNFSHGFRFPLHAGANFHFFFHLCFHRYWHDRHLTLRLAQILSYLIFSVFGTFI